MNETTTTILKPGMMLDDRYAILEFIGKGGMGEVYRAHQLNLKRDVAIKIISQEWLGSLEDDEEEIECALERFRREVQAMAQIRHPNVVQIYDYGSATIQVTDEELVVEYIAMEYIPGATLRFTMSEEGFSPEEDDIKTWLIDYFLPVLDGVQAMHSLGIVHRDLKPGNVLLDENTPKIADFGLARSCHMRPVTRSMDVKGSPLYMSPEHFLDLKRTDPRADIYTLGKILFEAIDGKISSETIPFRMVSLSNLDTPFLQELNRIIQAATAEDREERLGSVEKLRHGLLEAIDGSKIETTVSASAVPGRSSVLAHPRRIWAGIAVAIVFIATVALWYARAETRKSTVGPGVPPVSNQELLQPNPSRPSAVQPPFSPNSPVEQWQRREGYPDCNW
jgi:serine/threonine-protein kinase